MIDQMKNMIVGLFVMIAIGVIVGIILFIQPGAGDGGQKLNVRFSNINGINVGTRVLFAGKPIGEVIKVETIPGARHQPVDELGHLYIYQLVLSIDSKVKVYTTDEITLATSGLLGEKSISIVPKLPPRGVTPQLVTENTPLYADSVDPFQAAFHQISELADSMQQTIEKVNTWIDDNGIALGDAIRSFDSAMKQGTEMLKTVNNTHLVQDVKAGIQVFTDTTAEIGDVVRQLRCQGAFTNLSASLDSFRNVGRSLDTITSEVAAGRGSLGKILMSDQFYLELNAVMGKIETLMNDVNNYGLLFNLNKEWQRLRSKRANLINALDTPAKFKQFFENEVDTINSAMGRISLLIERVENTPREAGLFDSSLFQKDFAELLRLANQLFDTLKLYNEEFAGEACQ